MVELKVVPINPTGWDAEVQKSAEDTLEGVLAIIRKEGCRGVAVAWVERDRSAGTLYSKSSNWSTLKGGVSTLLHRMHEDNE